MDSTIYGSIRFYERRRGNLPPCVEIGKAEYRILKRDRLAHYKDGTLRVRGVPIYLIGTAPSYPPELIDWRSQFG